MKLLNFHDKKLKNAYKWLIHVIRVEWDIETIKIILCNIWTRCSKCSHSPLSEKVSITKTILYKFIRRAEIERHLFIFHISNGHLERVNSSELKRHIFLRGRRDGWRWKFLCNKIIFALTNKKKIDRKLFSN